MQEVPAMTLQQEIEELRREKESLEQRLESSNRQLEGLKTAYYEKCDSSVEEKRDLQRKLKKRHDLEILQKNHELQYYKELLLQQKDLKLQKNDTKLQNKEEEIESLKKKLSQVTSRLTECETQLKEVRVACVACVY